MNYIIVLIPDDNYVYYFGQESLRRNGVALIIHKIVWNAVHGWNLKMDRMISFISKANSAWHKPKSMSQPLRQKKNKPEIDPFYEELQYREPPDVQLDFTEAEEPEIQLSTILWSWRNQRNYRKTSTSASLTTLSFECVDHNELWKILRRLEYPATLPVSWETWMWVKKEQLELDMEK